MVGYLPNFSLLDLDGFWAIATWKNEGYNQSIFTVQAWSINKVLYGTKNTIFLAGDIGQTRTCRVLPTPISAGDCFKNGLAAIFPKLARASTCLAELVFPV